MSNDASYRTPKPKTHTVVSRIGLLVLIGFCVVFVASYTNRLERKAQVEQAILEVNQQIADADKHRLELLAELEYVQSPAYVESVARNYLDMARPGDTVIIVRDVPVNQPPDVLALEPPVYQNEPSVNQEPTWRQWLSLLGGDR